MDRRERPLRSEYPLRPDMVLRWEFERWRPGRENIPGRALRSDP